MIKEIFKDLKIRKNENIFLFFFYFVEKLTRMSLRQEVSIYGTDGLVERQDLTRMDVGVLLTELLIDQKKSISDVAKG